jgi:hypothetical protein
VYAGNYGEGGAVNMRMFGAKDKVLHDEEYQWRKIQRRLYQSDYYQEFQDYILYCAILAIHEQGGPVMHELKISEIQKLAEVDLNNKNAVLKIYSKYIGKSKYIYEIKRDAVEKIKHAAKTDLKTLDLIRKRGIEDIERWWWDTKYPPIKKSEPRGPEQLVLFKEAIP